MAPNPGGRPQCKATGCHSFAALSGFCKKHTEHWRMARGDIGPKVTRKNYIDDFNIHQGAFFSESFETVKDHFDIEDTY